MKFISLISALTLAFLVSNVSAQIDRSKRPEPGPAPKIKLGKPQTFTLDNGLKVMVVEDPKLPVVSINMTMDIDPFTLGDKAGLDELMGSLLGKGSTKTEKDVFEEEIDFMGATLEIFQTGAYASGLSKYFDQLVSMMAEAALMPNFTQKELDDERQRAIEGLKSEEKTPGSIASRVRNVLLYGKEHPFGEYVTAESLASITLEDVKNHYNTYFVPGKAYMIVMGDVKFALVKAKITQHFSSWKKALPPAKTYAEPKNVDQTQICFVDVPNAVQAEVAFVNLAKLSMNDPDYFPALIANEILGGSFESYLNKTLREEKAWTYGARSSLSASKHITSFRAGAPLKQTVIDSAVLEVIKQIDRIRANFVTADELSLAKATFAGDFIRESAKPRSISGFALRIETQGLPKNFYENYLANLEKVTQEDVKRVANKYFMTGNARIIVAAKASEVLEKLESTGLPMKFYDIYGNEIEKPQAKKIDPSLTVNAVLDNYFKAIGGKDKASAVKSLVVNAKANIPGAPAPLDVKSVSTSSGHMKMEMTMGAMSIMKQVVTPEMAYSMQQGQRSDLEGNELKQSQAEAIPFKEFNFYNNENVKLQGIENINGSDAYVIQFGENRFYYDVNSGLKVAESNEVENQGKKTVVWTYYNDYKTVEGLQMPYQIVQLVGVEIKMDVVEVLINSAVNMADFK